MYYTKKDMLCNMNRKVSLPPGLSTKTQEDTLGDQLKIREKSRTVYWNGFDPFIDVRLGWRASTMRHLFHILPGQRILEIGAGDGRFTQALVASTRKECELTAAVFSDEYEALLKTRFKDSPVRVKHLKDFPGALRTEKFDYIVAHHMLEDKTRDAFLNVVKPFIKPGGGLLLFETNPWNPYYRIRKMFRRLLPVKWRRPSEPISLNRLHIFSVLSEIGYTQINALPHDFLYAPIPRVLLWPAQNLSLIMENCPLIRNFAGSLYIWARNGACDPHERQNQDLCEHPLFMGKVSFVIPCHNEEMNILPLIEGLKNFYERYILEVIIVDDNSRDKTALIAEKLSEQDDRIRVIKRSPPKGVGRALREGIAAAEGEYIVIMDCDFQDILPEIRDLFDAVAQGADVAVGSRFSRESVVLNYSFSKIIANRTFHLLANMLLGRHFRDMSNNLKIFKKDVAKAITIEFDDFAANAETGLKPLLSGYRVVEIPISWMNRSIQMGLSSFHITKTGPNYCRLLFRLVCRRISRAFTKAGTV